VDAPSTPPIRYRPKPSPIWALITIVAGVAGAVGAITVAAHGTYDMPPFRAELRAWPSFSGKTEIAVRAPVVGKAHAEAPTHQAPISFRVTIVGVSSSAKRADLLAIRDPHALVTAIGKQDSTAVRSFAIKVGLLALGGGLAGGLLISFGRWKRIVGGALAGLLVIAIVGVVVKATYNADNFTGTRFVVDHGSLDVLPSVLPRL
jgi:hypothetical protein